MNNHNLTKSMRYCPTSGWMLRRDASVIDTLTARTAELEAENERLREALLVILKRAYKMSPIDNVWVQGVCDAALEANSDG